MTGPYISLGAGMNLLQNEVAVPRSRTFDPGFAVQSSIGYGFGNGIRAEIEGNYLRNQVRVPRQTGQQMQYGGMANLFYDFDLGLPIYPYAGIGAGGQILTANLTATDQSQSVGSFAYQGIIGLSAPMQWLPGLSFTADYRMIGLPDPLPAFREVAFSRNEKLGNVFNHQITLGFRYDFGAPPAAAPPVEAVIAVPAPVPARTYLVFFDWDRSDLGTRAKQIIAEAAGASTRVQVTRIAVQGNADRSGDPAYNQTLSVRRAQTVASELVRLGVSRTIIEIQGFGDTKPLVPTAAGTREPQNRRVEIILQ